MDVELTAATGFAGAGAVSLIATPLAIRIAKRTDFYDRPREYRKHGAPTPFLGGAAVLAAFVVATLGLGAAGSRLAVLPVCAAIMWLIGTIDDRFAVAPKWRVLAATGAAVVLSESGLGWNTFADGGMDVLLTVVWTVGLVNAFNLMDNLDGACATVASVSAAGVGVLASIKGETMIVGMSFALSGACAGYLRWNLARPAKIFLGDGGSMPVGFLVGALAMATARHSVNGRAGVLMGALLAGLAILDVTLVSFSRSRRGVSLVTGGRDHLTHRILLAVHSPRKVAAVLAAAQALLCSLAILAYELGTMALVAVSFVAFATGVVSVLVLDTARWRPAGIAIGGEPVRASVEPPDGTAVRLDTS